MGEKKPFKKIFNKVVNLIMEEEVEIVDNGLDDVDSTITSEPVENSSKIDKKDEVKEVEQKVVEKEEVKEQIENKKEEVKEVKIKNKKSFMKPKTKTLEEDLFKNEEIKTTMELIKENPVPMVEIIENKNVKSSVSAKSDFKYEKAQPIADNVTNELTDEQKEAEEFHAKLDASELAIKKIRSSVLFKDIEFEVFGNGFENTFFELMDAIEENQILERSEKTSKMNKMLFELMKINADNEEEVYDCFMIIRHELHKAKNGLGEYDSRVHIRKETYEKYVLDYKIPELYENKEVRHLLLESDIRSFTELMSLVDTMYMELSRNSFITKEKRERMQNEYTDLLWYSSSICEILKNIELLKYDLYKLNNGLDEFSKTALALY